MLLTPHEIFLKLCSRAYLYHDADKCNEWVRVDVINYFFFFLKKVYRVDENIGSIDLTPFLPILIQARTDHILC